MSAGFSREKKLQVFLGEKQEGEEVGTVTFFRRKHPGVFSKVFRVCLRVFCEKKQEEEEGLTVITFRRKPRDVSAFFFTEKLQVFLGQKQQEERGGRNSDIL